MSADLSQRLVPDGLWELIALLLPSFNSRPQGGGTLPASSEAMIHVASIDNLAKRITDETTPTWRGTY